MPHSYLKVVGNPEYRCNNSSPRYMRENHYAILVFRLKISYVFKYKISITLLLILTCLGKSFLNPLAKIHNLIDNREYRVFFLLRYSCSVSKPVPLFPEPLGNRLPVYCQAQSAFIVRVVFNP